MTLLCVETSSTRGSLCVSFPDGKRVEKSWEKMASHSEVITSNFQQLQAEARFTAKDLTHLAIDIGPGSFTGIRVGLSFVKTLAYCFDLPTACLNSFEIVASKPKFSGKVLFVLSAVRGHSYVCGYDFSTKEPSVTLPPCSRNDKEISELTLRFDHVVTLNEPDLRPRSEEMALLLGLKTRMFNFVSWKDINPLYLRRSEAEEKLEAGLLKPIYSK